MARWDMLVYGSKREMDGETYIDIILQFLRLLPLRHVRCRVEVVCYTPCIYRSFPHRSDDWRGRITIHRAKDSECCAVGVKSCDAGD
jgi:hypothetical protein